MRLARNLNATYVKVARQLVVRNLYECKDIFEQRHRGIPAAVAQTPHGTERRILVRLKRLVVAIEHLRCLARFFIDQYCVLTVHRGDEIHIKIDG